MPTVYMGAYRQFLHQEKACLISCSLVMNKCSAGIVISLFKTIPWIKAEMQ